MPDAKRKLASAKWEDQARSTALLDRQFAFCTLQRPDRLFSCSQALPGNTPHRRLCLEKQAEPARHLVPKPSLGTRCC